MTQQQLHTLRQSVLRGSLDDLRLIRQSRATLRSLSTRHEFYPVDLDRITGYIRDCRDRTKSRISFYRNMVRKYGM